MFVISVSLNYQKLPLPIREQFVFSKPETVRANRLLNTEKSILENVILSTCNRTEVYAVVDQIHTGRYYIKRFLANWFHVDLEQINQWVKVETERAAVTHIFRVAAGLESLIAGEPQILGQVKAAFFVARDQSVTGVILNHLFQQAVTVAKQLHTDYRVSELSQTSGQAALHQIKVTLGRLNGKVLTIVGLGEEGQHVLKNASTMGFQKILIVNRTAEKATRLAQQFGTGVYAASLNQLPLILGQTDALIMATAAKTPLLAGSQLQSAVNRLKIIVDLGVPRNVAQSGLPQEIEYDDLDHLTAILSQNQHRKQAMLQQMAAQIPAAVADFYRWQQELHVVPIIRELRESSLKVEESVYDSLVRKLPDLDAHAQKVIHKHLKSIVNQMIKGPIKQIKELSTTADAHDDLAFFCQLFDLTMPETESRVKPTLVVNHQVLKSREKWINEN